MTTFANPRHLARLHSPIGRIELTADGAAITSLTIEKDGTLPHDRLPERPGVLLERAVEQLHEYFTGARRRFELPLTLAGTAFQLAVWMKLGELGWGEVTSYGAIGLATGRATAGRAVGGALRANPVPIIVPCHRVLAAGGKITGYSAGQGVPTKVWLLDHEGIIHTTRAAGV